MESSLPAFPHPIIDIALNHLQSDTLALWGQMSAQHMLEHLEMVLHASIGKFNIPFPTDEGNTQRIKQMILLSDHAFRRNFKAPFLGDSPPPLKYKDLSQAKESLKNSIALFEKYYLENPDMVHTHPVFGSLTYAEWKVFHAKHFAHHFNQFGLFD